jgi:hypothetical protein
VALSGLEREASMRDEVRDLASSIASNPDAGWARAIAIDTLIFLPAIMPEMWEWAGSLPEKSRWRLHEGLGNMIAESRVEALEVLERWMRASTDPQHLGDLLLAFMVGLFKRLPEAPTLDFQTRLVQDIDEARRRGALPGHVAVAMVVALFERTDDEVASLGLEELALATIAGGPVARKLLMDVFVVRPADSLWAPRLLGRLLEAAADEEKEAWINTFVGDYQAKYPACVAVRERLLQSRASA